MALRDHADVQDACVPGRLIDRVLEVELVCRALTGKSPEPSKRDLDIARAELQLVVQISILTSVPHLGCPAVPRALLADANAFRVIAIGAERRGSRRADPFVAALVPPFLLRKAFTQRFHQFLEPAKRLYLRAFFFRENEFGLMTEPFLRQFRRQRFKCVFYAVEVCGENLVEAVKL